MRKIVDKIKYSVDYRDKDGKYDSMNIEVPVYDDDNFGDAANRIDNILLKHAPNGVTSIDEVIYIMSLNGNDEDEYNEIECDYYVGDEND